MDYFTRQYIPENKSELLSAAAEILYFLHKAHKLSVFTWTTSYN
jgi:hypothetical protein